MQPLMSDIEGLTKVAPLSRRGFMTAAGAAAAGYTLAAGPVRADAIHTSAEGLNAGMAKVAVAGGDMPLYFAEPLNAEKPPIILVAMEVFGLHEYIKDVTRPHQARCSGGCAGLLFPLRRCLEDRRSSKAAAGRRSEAG